MRHNELDPEFPCDGELIETQESTETLTVMWCLGCCTEFRFTPDSELVFIVCPGMRRSMDWRM